MLEVQRILKMMTSDMLYKLFRISDLTDLEYKILQEFIIREKPRDAICDDLGVSRSTFTNAKNIALTKIKINLNNLLDEKIKQMG